MHKKIAILGLVAALSLAVSSAAFGSQAIFGAVGNINSTDAAAFGPTAGGAATSVGCRVYSVSGTTLTINGNAAVCVDGASAVNNRCIRSYNSANTSLQGGYICQGENTAPYNNDADGQTYYELIDGQANAGACNHAAYYSAQGGIMSSLVLTPGVNSGNQTSDACSVPSSVNCFTKANPASARPAPLLNTNSSAFAGDPAHTIRSTGGLSPVPTVRVAAPGTAGCVAGQSRLTWDDPETYATTMKNGVATPVIGVRLYSNPSLCSACPNGDAGWVAGAAFPLGAGAAGVCVPIGGDTWFALTVRLTGPGAGGGSEIETGIVGGTGFVGANSQCVGNVATASRITNLTARYAGRGSVNVNWTTGTEGGVQSFYVTRGSSPNGPFTRVSGAFAPAGDAHSYSYNDKVHSALGRVQYYGIEIVNADGSSEQSGTMAVTLPAAKKKLGTN